MARVEFAQDTAQTKDFRQDRETELVALLATHVENTGKKLPEPMPTDFTDAVRWWMTAMSAPETPGEAYHGPGRDGGMVVVTHDFYLRRVRVALRAFLGLEDGQRKTVARGVIGDKVHYRGESFATYMRIWEETQRCRNMGLQAYRAEAIKGLKKVLGGLAR